jgi:hypothetical protein
MQTHQHTLLRLLLLLSLTVLIVAIGSAEIKVTAVKGDVSVRRGTDEQWLTLAPGDILKPEDSMRLGKHSSASILTGDGRQLVLPELVQLDLADVRSLTQEELLLQLAMERVRSVPDRDRKNDLSIPRTTTVHGSNRGATTVHHPVSFEAGPLQLNGVKVLFRNGFYATGVLRAKELFRLMPDLANDIDSRMMVAGGLEKMNVDAEALAEYTDIKKANLSEAQRMQIDQRVTLLKKRSR